MKTCTFNIKRFDPEKASTPRWAKFSVEMEQTERLLDGLIKIKDNMDGTLTFRRSCAHGICGSCAVKINGKNGLACQTLIKDMPDTITLEPLEAYPVIKDLVVDMSPFFEKNDKVMPYLVNDETPPDRERLQSPEDQHKILQSITCIMCGSCTSSCPGYWANKDYLGPSALLKAYRFIFDTRDNASGERLEKIIHNNGLWRCRSIYNCVEVCPKEIDITGHLSKLKRLAVKKKLLERK
ncbi:MAG TPA: succinate dehydrogenase iron-sulfur subunit [Nitrospirae bacterium]|nr:succinate dehydrogenase iron-sulfur subunit [bacterium BMS3Abin06]HDH10799.1 succinate dehydrogenase iron-sulfur subunit [Nitrospirota bacterium]HDZ00957.1 succinate dehydrogenase iron-sulfur subunit [Nitrospirota bacterium]